ncbi:MAG TPA: hypothetical protein VF624_18265 [Tepidisphaeraceae bacterium]
MKPLYFILATAGWTWLVALAVFVAVRRHKRRRPGFDAISSPADESPQTVGNVNAAAVKDAPPM